MTPQLRYDEIPWDDFLLALNFQVSQAKKVLIPESKLRDFRITGSRNRQGNAFLDPDPKKNVDFIFFFLREPDLVTQTVHQYLILFTDSESAEELLKLAQRLRLDLRAKGLDTLFHIDTHYGIVTGATLEPVSRFGAKQRPGCFVTLVFTRNPSHPLLVIPDWVDREDKPRLMQIFEKYNHVPAAKKSLMQKMFGPSQKLEPSPGWRYKLIHDLYTVMNTRYLLFFQKISLIFENVSENEIETCILNRKLSTTQTAGTSRFFTSTEELLQ